jgi:4-hydroxybenzoyl-CoA thioesterase/acyl-CoA thioester hydrolase
MPAFRTRRRVEFRDTDAAGLMHFSSFFVYMEQAEHEFLRSIGLSVLEREGDGAVTWPRVWAVCDYCRPLRFEDEFEIEVAVERLGERSVTYVFRFLHEGQDAATGRITVVCCRVDKTAPVQSTAIPSRIAEKLRPFLIKP